jgi:single-strand DNA-binding protein
LNINYVILIGRLTGDAELKYTAGGQPVCRFSIAVNRAKKSGEKRVDDPHFFDMVLWGKQAETLKIQADGEE